MSDGARIPVALVGLGDIGLGQHLPALLRSPDVEVVALADMNPARRASASALVGPHVPVEAELEDVLASRVTGVVLATPPWATPELAIQVLRSGRFVLAEKPVATSVAAAAVYDQLNDDERRRLQIGLTYRHDPAIQRLGEWIRDGRLGSPVLVRAHIYDERLDPADAEHAERLRRTLEHGMPVVHEGAHVFDWLSFWLGQPVSMDDAWAMRTQADLPAPNIAGARLTYPGGHAAQVEFGWLTEALPRSGISVLGARGHVLLDTASFRLELSTTAGTDAVEFPGERSSRCFDLQVTRFAELICGGRDRPDPDLGDGLAALETAERVARMALSEGRPVVRPVADEKSKDVRT